MATQPQAGPERTVEESAVSRRLPSLLVAAAIVYFIMPWDLDFIPVVGRLDDLFFLALAGYYKWRQASGSGRRTRRRPAAERGPADFPRAGAQSEGDPYQLLGVAKADDASTIKKAYRDLVAKYHPDRVQHLGEEFKVLAASRTTAINKAYETIKRARGLR